MFLMRRLAIWLGARSWMPKFLPQIVWLDKTIARLTGERMTLMTMVGIPQVHLTVPGRKSGIPRTTPLLCVPHDGGWLVAGSNWGAPKPPVWIGNLAAAENPDVLFRGKHYRCTRRKVEGEERAKLWRIMNETWPNYDGYQAKTDREITVWELKPVSGGPSPRVARE